MRREEGRNMEWKITSACAKLLGRTYKLDGTLWLSLSASGAEWEFTGVECTVNLEGDALSGDIVHSPRYAIEVDDVRVVDATMGETRHASHTVIKTEQPGRHIVRVLKLSESEDSTLGITSVTGHGELRPTPQKLRRIEFIGDSITCGYGVDGRLGELYSTSNEDATKAYAYRTAQALHVDHSLVSFSGYGIISGYTETGMIRSECTVPPIYATMGDSYGAFGDRVKPSDVPWDFSRFVPDLIVVNLGTNDASYCTDDAARHEMFTSAYAAFLEDVSAHNPGATLACVLGTMDGRLTGCVKNAAERFGAEHPDVPIHTMFFEPQDEANDGLAVDWHPSARTHERDAKKLAAWISGLPEWK